MRMPKVFLLYVSVINRCDMFSVSADDDESGNCGKHHENRKCCAHGNKFRQKAGKKFAGKRSDSIEHKEGSVESTFYVIRNIGLRC